MKATLTLACIAMLFASCRSYQVNTLSSANMRKNDSTGVFTVENDSLLITYSFAGKNSPLHVQVMNKLNEPMVINWERSALIVRDKAYSYVDENIKITGETDGSTVQYNIDRDIWGNVRYNSGTFNATIKLSKNESFLPPHSKSGRSIYVLGQVGLANIDKEAFNKMTLRDVDGITPIYTKTADFTAENSPLKFKSYLTLYTLNNNKPQPFVNEQDFFVSNVTKLNLSPNNVSRYSNNPGDVLINAKTTNFGKTMAIVGTVGLVGGLSAADAAVNDKQKP